MIISTMFRAFFFTVAVLIVGLNTQVVGQAQSLTTRLRQGGALEAPGTIPTFYEASTKERALRLQQSLKAAHEWYQQQLNVKVPIVLVVLHNATRERILGTTAIDHTFFPHDGEPGMIALGDANPAAQPIPGADAEHDVGGILHNEHLLFHEDGHFFADALKIGSTSKSVYESTSKSLYEFVPSIFMVAYIQQARPDLKFNLEALRKVDSRPLPRYTSWADFDYYPQMNTPNHQWFLGQLERIADVLSLNQNFPTLVKKLGREFPEDAAKMESPEDIKMHLVRINPAFKPPQESLFGPTTIPPAAKTTCGQSKTGGDGSVLLIRNNRPKPLTVLLETTSVVVQPYSLRQPIGLAGTVITVSGDTCYMIGTEPTIVTVN